MIVEDLYYASGETNIHFVLDIFIGHATVHLVDCYVIIELYGGNSQGGAFVLSLLLTCLRPGLGV
jgi:hypothetical protein